MTRFRFASGARAAPKSALQPLIYPADIVAAYAFNEPGAACNTDRSGKGLDFSLAAGDQLASEIQNVMDLVPGKAACLASTTAYPTSPARCRKLSQSFVQYGVLTCTMRIWVPLPVHIVNVDYSLCYLNATDTTTGSTALQWVLATKPSPNRYTLAYYSERNKAGQLHMSTTLDIQPNEWLFLSLRRFADGSVRQGVHRGKKGASKTYQTSAVNDLGGALQMPLSANTASFAATFAETSFSTSQHSACPWADWVLWGNGRLLSDAEIDAQAAVVLAGVP